MYYNRRNTCIMLSVNAEHNTMSVWRQVAIETARVLLSMSINPYYAKTTHLPHPPAAGEKRP